MAVCRQQAWGGFWGQRQHQELSLRLLFFEVVTIFLSLPSAFPPVPTLTPRKWVGPCWWIWLYFFFAHWSVKPAEVRISCFKSCLTFKVKWKWVTQSCLTPCDSVRGIHQVMVSKTHSVTWRPTRPPVVKVIKRRIHNRQGGGRILLEFCEQFVSIPLDCPFSGKGRRGAQSAADDEEISENTGVYFKISEPHFEVRLLWSDSEAVSEEFDECLRGD